MATVEELLNKGKCAIDGSGNNLGLETSKGCATLITSAKTIIMIHPNEEIRNGETLEDEIDRLMLAGKMDIARGVQNFEENGSDDATETLPDDTMRVTNEGKYAFLATFTNGLFFNKALHSLKGFKRWDILLVDQNGVYGHRTETGLAGFTTGMIQPAKLSFPSPSQGQTEGLKFQFLERYELDSDYGFIMDTSLRKLKGVTEVALNYVNEPAATDTDLRVKATLAMDSTTLHEGGGFENFSFTSGGTTNDPSAGDDTGEAGVYDLTISALAAGDSTELRMPVHKGADGDFYKGSSVSYDVPE
jgi:hypothetical protein